ncbi:flagellar hook-associated protein FlgK [Paraburkholderia unamae]|uniref:Flagellar hook-associated protein 1 n=1 Tax=Paraburkholderia unamae TaxID=219649 RepID=A0ABX5KYC1_9BURK|nr:flagellar hook-associated protein FlgK [Paraburkholderia unamae]PVX97378.1 flagellar hook-associated protein 1 FlgK [Paraburkholderia unamae]RAR66664.1 flagellar hook-associated protein 1 FlgK [Paraburkholderia unamae]CAG9253821.1 Flagellar hook-associated protein flgK [Paraburkholderia unamae]
MSNIFSIGLSGLQAAQIGIATTGENISNSTTAGYTVESPVYQESAGQYTSSGYIGGGVTTATVQRAYSQYLTTALNNAQSTNSSYTASYTLATQLSNLVGSPTSGIATAVTNFFSGLQNVSNSPSSTAARQTVLSDAQTLATQINAAGQQYDAMRQSVNTQLTSAVTQINSYTQQIANLNAQITSASATGQQPNQLLDQRDQAVANLSQLVGVQVVQGSSGYSVFLGNGQPLVVSNQSYNLGTQPSSTNSSELAVTWVGMNGASASSLGTPQVLNSAALQGGTVGGLVSFVQDTLDPAEAQLGAIVTSFAAQVNAQNALGLTLSGGAGGDLFTVGSPVVTAASGNADASLTPSVQLTGDTSALTLTDSYALSYDNASSTWTLTDSTTNTKVDSATPGATSPFTIGGLSITLPSTPTGDDSYTIQPLSANPLSTFSVATSDPAAIAAATPVVVSAATTNAGTGNVTQGSVGTGYSTTNLPATLTYDSSAGTLTGLPNGTVVQVTVGGATTSVTVDNTTTPPTNPPYDPTNGASYTITNLTDSKGANGVATNISFTMSGTPSNNDSFTIDGNKSGTQDGRNALALANLTSSTAFSGSLTLTSAYANYVNSIGNTASQLKAQSTSQASLVTQLTSQQQSVQGVNLDEEAANLLQYQQLYQANSKVIQTAASLFQTLIGIF